MLITTQFLSWGPNIVNIAGQSLLASPISRTSLTHIAALNYGSGRHVQALGSEGLFGWFKVLYAFEFLYTLAMSSVKYSMYAPLHLLPPGL